MKLTEAEIEQFCEAFHDAYERAAVNEGWQTQTRSRQPWAYVPAENKATMRAAAREVLARHDADVIEKCAGLVAGYGQPMVTDHLLQQAEAVRSEGRARRDAQTQ
jgi:hypothetical protein